MSSLLGEQAGELGSDHSRWQLYLLAMESDCGCELLFKAVGLEEDMALASAVVVRMIERVEKRDREKWIMQLPVDQRRFAERRASELSVLCEVVDGAMGAREISLQMSEWSDWLQLRVAGRSSSDSVLAVVEELARTKRARRVSGERRNSSNVADLTEPLTFHRPSGNGQAVARI
ncbi:hypothetical protein [Fodinicola feengrottensis]|uniref:hypothetical protein n=1 Tax=Fodinicola feengrottensis TaxID=435914 RepID=UPI0031DBB525